MADMQNRYKHLLYLIAKSHPNDRLQTITHTSTTPVCSNFKNLQFWQWLSTTPVSSGKRTFVLVTSWILAIFSRRPKLELAFAVLRLVRHLNWPCTKHMYFLSHILRYLLKTINHETLWLDFSSSKLTAQYRHQFCGVKRLKIHDS